MVRAVSTSRSPSSPTSLRARGLLVLWVILAIDATAWAQSPATGDAKPLLFLSKTPGAAPDGDWEIYLADAALAQVDRLSWQQDRTVAWLDALERAPGEFLILVASKRWGDTFDLTSDTWVASNDALANAVNGPMQRLEIHRLDTTVAPPALVLERRLLDTRVPSESSGFTRVWHPTFDPRAGDAETPEIVFAAALPGEVMNLWRIRSDGSGLARLIDDPMRTSNDPSWGHDGWIYYVHSSQPGEPLAVWNTLDAWRVDPATGLRQRVTNEAIIPGEARANSDPVASPDGGTVLVLRNDESRWSSIDAQAPDGGDWYAAQSYTDPWRTHGVVHFESTTGFVGERWTDCFLVVVCDHQIYRSVLGEVDAPVELLWSSRETGVEVSLPVPLPEAWGGQPLALGLGFAIGLRLRRDPASRRTPGAQLRRRSAASRC